MSNGFIKLHGTHRFTGGNINSHADRTLVQVGFTIRSGSGKAHHRHDRITFEHDNPYIGYAFIAETLKTVIKLN
ncbi:Uncharacterised protein [Vibrio cholerae]|uniref:Uncharacterized protein n=1 Tax=Vibrio cholerae TaxID=666 RepID=A0A655UN60_VIBCL|nr:Uncharacterised protein [Vibrio cholerae]